MASVLITPTALTTEVDQSEVVSLQIVTDEADWRGLFQQLEVWRSRTGSGGPYEELTAASARPARVPRLAADPPETPEAGRSVVLVGADLRLKVNDTDIVIVFDGADPLTYSDCASQVLIQSAGRVTAYVTESGEFVLQSSQYGTAVELQVVGGEAAPVLGLLTGDAGYGYGRDARVTLISSKEQYDFTDNRGSRTAYYKTRFRNVLDASTSAFSIPFAVGQAMGLPQDLIVVGYLELVTSAGRPYAGAEVNLWAPQSRELIQGKLVGGQGDTQYTDRDGRVEFSMVRGVSYTLSVPNSQIVRGVKAPTNPSVTFFNLLEAPVDVADSFLVAEVPQLAIKRDLEEI